MPIDSHLPQADPFSLVPTFKQTITGFFFTTFFMYLVVTFA
jgi:hypothetical protein